MFLKYAVQLLAAASCVASASASDSNMISIKTMKILDEALPDDKFIRDLYTRFRPYLSVDKNSCCTPFPVVDGNGTTVDTSSINVLKDCQKKDDSEGQIYARGMNADDPANPQPGQFAIMYSWYFPTIHDSVFKWKLDDWQQVIVWLSGNGTDANNYHISYVAYSQPRGYHNEQASEGLTNPLVWYTTIGRKDHLDGRGLMPTQESGWPFKMITWEKFTDQARAAVSDKKRFEKANTAPFSDDRFVSHINASLHSW